MGGLRGGTLAQVLDQCFHEDRLSIRRVPMSSGLYSLPTDRIKHFSDSGSSSARGACYAGSGECPTAESTTRGIRVSLLERDSTKSFLYVTAQLVGAGLAGEIA